MQLNVNDSDETTEEMNGGCSSTGHPGGYVCSVDFLVPWR